MDSSKSILFCHMVPCACGKNRTFGLCLLTGSELQNVIRYRPACVWKESNFRPLSYQDSVLPLNYTRTQRINPYFILNERTGYIPDISGQRSTIKLHTHFTSLKNVRSPNDTSNISIKGLFCKQKSSRFLERIFG